MQNIHVHFTGHVAIVAKARYLGLVLPVWLLVCLHNGVGLITAIWPKLPLRLVVPIHSVILIY